MTCEPTIKRKQRQNIFGCEYLPPVQFYTVQAIRLDCLRYLTGLALFNDYARIAAYFDLTKICTKS